VKIVRFCLRGGIFAHTTAGKTRWKGVIFSMRKVVLCLFYALCAFAIAFSLPHTDQPPPKRVRVVAGMVVGDTHGPDGSPTRLARQTDIYVNLLPENDALRVKQGMTVTGDAALQEVLEDLGG